MPPPIPIPGSYIEPSVYYRPFHQVATETDKIDELTEDVMVALQNLKHTYLGHKTILDPSWGRDKFRTLEKKHMCHFKSCVKGVTEYLDIMQEWVDEIEKELKEEASNR
jgi:hypothetical protein